MTIATLVLSFCIIQALSNVEKKRHHTLKLSLYNIITDHFWLVSIPPESFTQGLSKQTQLIFLFCGGSQLRAPSLYSPQTAILILAASILHTPHKHAKWKTALSVTWTAENGEKGLWRIQYRLSDCLQQQRLCSEFYRFRCSNMFQVCATAEGTMSGYLLRPPVLQILHRSSDKWKVGSVIGGFFIAKHCG